MDQTFPIIAIDGGAASGKSSTARGVAEKLDFLHVDTGAHYRALTWMAQQGSVSLDEPEEVTLFLENLQLDTHIAGRSAWIVVNGQQPTDADIRSQAVTAEVSRLAAIAAVREAVKGYQRAQAGVAQRAGYAGLVMEGRDIGSVIFPEASAKFFLEADPAVRAQRRSQEGGDGAALAERDRLDQSRKTAPLVCPSDACRIDTSALTLNEVIDQVCQHVRQVIAR